uniref:Uncharacterized protein n=1 Tax=Trichobilharzia regenti TaxID=157069 RepID=A0AA85IZH5_TRIRE|nr:unnamed protein product [Trichobilharzia regenti]
MDKTVSHVSDPGDCISLPSSPSSELSLSRLHGARVRNRLDNTSLSSSMQNLSDTLVRSQSEGEYIQTNRLQHVVNTRISRNNNSSSNDSFKYSNANDKKSMKTVGSSLKSSGKWTSCSSVTTTTNLKQLKLTDMFPVNKTVKSATSCNNSLSTSNYVLQSVNRIFCTYK